MKLIKSKLIAVIALLLLVGQVAASPLLMCVEMSQIIPEPQCHSAGVVHPTMTDMADLHASHALDEPASLISDHGSNQSKSPLCELCASCSSATGSNATSAQALPVLALDEDGYSSDLMHSTRTTPFRPPIAA
jgi:hypothetical protein